MAENTPPVTPTIPPKKSKPRDPIYVVIIILLLIGMGLLYYQMNENKKQLEKCSEDNKKLSADSNRYRSELDFAISELGTSPEAFLGDLQTLLTDYDTMISISSDLENENSDLMDSLEAKRAEILELEDQVKRGKWTAYELTKKTKELEVLRGVLKTYVHRIDSLTTQNQALSQRLGNVETKLNEAVETIGQYEVKTEQMTETISKGKVLKAAEINAQGYRLKSNGDERPTDRAKRADRVKACFKIVENAIAKAGTKSIYLRVLDPSGKVMSDGRSFKSASREEVKYSDKRDIDYQNTDISLCIYYIFGQDVSKGTYKVEVWADGHKIGNSTFDLK